VVQPLGVVNPIPLTNGLIQIFTGDGKGKTTAALGEAVRAVGAGKRVAIVYFDKGGSHYSERKTLKECFSGSIDFVATGRDRIDPHTGRFDFSLTQEDQDEAKKGLEQTQSFLHDGLHDLVILDEINSTAHLGMISIEDVCALLDHKPEHIEIILTGRHAPEAFLDRAHLITDVRMVKHYFYAGINAREGLDW